MRYLRELVLPHPAMKTIGIPGINAAHARVGPSKSPCSTSWKPGGSKPAVEALMAFRGVQLVAAMITVSELGDIHRFKHPRQLMTYLGLVRTESTSGPNHSHQRWLHLPLLQN